MAIFISYQAVSYCTNPRLSYQPSAQGLIRESRADMGVFGPRADMGVEG